jgi:hypothetical protein
VGEAITRSRIFGRRNVGEVGFGAWAIGGSCGRCRGRDAIAASNAALDSDDTFIDATDVDRDCRGT